MNRFEKAGITLLLADAHDVLAMHGYAGKVGNGHRCMTCGRYGQGTTEDHEERCRGARLVTDIEAAIEVLKQ